jgi:hypothetical protein
MVPTPFLEPYPPAKVATEAVETSDQYMSVSLQSRIKEPIEQ